MELVAADTEKINAQAFRVDLIFPIGLDSVHMEKGLGLFFLDDFPDILNGLHGSHLVIYIHHGHQDGLRPQALPKLGNAYMAIGVHGKIGDVKPLVL